MEILSISNYIIVLAEPGGGKTALLDSIAQQLGTSAVTANVFRHMGTNTSGAPLVIDAFDELAKIDQTGVNQLLANAKKASPTHLIISSRSSEWSDATTNSFKDFFGRRPLVARLVEFNNSEQRLIFNAHIQGEDFSNFQKEVTRFDLQVLLSNPQFLKLFADAYIESERHFKNKISIFLLAIERLAKETNPNITKATTPLATTQKISLSSEAFTKILLSGAEGVSTSEANEDRMYPLLASLFQEGTSAEGILTSRLFKPGDSTNQHRPVHKIVAEYCAANYLIKRIADPSDPLTLSKCLVLIAPNSIVRDELRGLLGWMASHGNEAIQEAAIELDPYAVLANGDPSQLGNSSKRLLIKKLVEIEKKDPYFRRGDFWRRFSVAGFFTKDVAVDIKPLIATESDGHLRDLILELLVDSQINSELSTELYKLALAPNVSASTRLLASECLLTTTGYDYSTLIARLLSEATSTSLMVSANIIKNLPSEKIDKHYLADFFRSCSLLYPGHQEYNGRTTGTRYFIKQLIETLNAELVEWLLDELSSDLECRCGKEHFECDCRNGISKIIGSMLDRHFEISSPPFDAKRVWKWIGNLNFHERTSASQSSAVRVLQEDDDLRQGIISHVFGKLTDRDQIFEVKIHKFDTQTHAGLCFKPDDYKFIVDLAFEIENPNLWARFIARHQPYRNKEDRGTDSLRRHMREQALESPLFMRVWAASNRDMAEFERKQRFPRFRRTRKIKRRRKNQENIHIANKDYIQNNRELIEGGRHWGYLVRFAELTLMSPKKIEDEFGDEELVRSALINCLDFISPEMPDLSKLAELQCSSKTLQSEMILYAACLEILRNKCHLEDVSPRLLRVLRTNINLSYSAVSSDERELLKSEIDRLAFTDSESIENFLRQYIEPQLAQKNCTNSDVWILRRDDIFSNLRAKLSIEWLRNFHDLNLISLNELFETAVQHADHTDLQKIIAERCFELISSLQNFSAIADFDNKLEFWLLRSWYFLEDAPEIYWNLLKNNKKTALSLYSLNNRLNRHNNSQWPDLKPKKVEAILDAFIDKWPKIDLPSHWGTDSPDEENAYRFLTEIVWSLNLENTDDSIISIERLISDARFIDFHNDLKSIHFEQVRKKNLRDFEAPTPQDIVSQLDNDTVVTVEGLRQLITQELHTFQRAINGGEFNSADRFYEKGERLGEVRSTEIIAERLNLRLEPQGISVVLEHQLKSAKRCDFTVSKMIGGRRVLLVTEVKGQWHDEIYTAASAQLYERYSIHPDAAQQGIFLAIWFGKDEKVAGLKQHNIKSAQELKASLEEVLPLSLKGLIDVFVLDVSRGQ